MCVWYGFWSLDMSSPAITSAQRCLPKLCRNLFMLSCSESLTLSSSSYPFNYNLLLMPIFFYFNNILVSYLSKCKRNYLSKYNMWKHALFGWYQKNNIAKGHNISMIEHNLIFWFWPLFYCKSLLHYQNRICCVKDI